MKLFNLLVFLCITGVSGCKYQAPSPSEFRVFQEVSSLEEFHSLAKRQGLSSPTLLIYRGELRSVLEQYHFGSLGVKYSFFTLNAETADGQTLIRTLPIKLIPALVNYKEKTAVSVTYYAQEGKAAATMQLLNYIKRAIMTCRLFIMLKHREISANIPNWLSIHNELLRVYLKENWVGKTRTDNVVDYVDNVGLDIAQELLKLRFSARMGKIGNGYLLEADWQLSQLAVRSVSLAALTKNQELLSYKPVLGTIACHESEPIRFWLYDPFFFLSFKPMKGDDHGFVSLNSQAYLINRVNQKRPTSEIV